MLPGTFYWVGFFCHFKIHPQCHCNVMSFSMPLLFFLKGKGRNTKHRCLCNFFLTFEKWEDVLNVARIPFGYLYIIRL